MIEDHRAEPSHAAIFAVVVVLEVVVPRLLGDKDEALTKFIVELLTLLGSSSASSNSSPQIAAHSSRASSPLENPIPSIEYVAQRLEPSTCFLPSLQPCIHLWRW
ncbi:Hypothetical predicted protein [Olea europaea subsp. europaea]|uniref:Uncharacterized protein n=1 Tax=Olea europaea subsp. europaea TaxID=158383 RepID=A0A8S0SMV1_OLEEU|nr:Hypothetical predicted protein [Olea europaea subsp. europaea]